MSIIKTEEKEEKSVKYSTDEEGMMEDAKGYARRDMSTIVKVLEKLGFNTEENIELITKATVAVKYEQIDKARNDRPSWEKYL